MTTPVIKLAQEIKYKGFWIGEYRACMGDILHAQLIALPKRPRDREYINVYSKATQKGIITEDFKLSRFQQEINNLKRRINRKGGEK